MSYELILDNEWVTVQYHTTDHYIHHTFHQPISGEIFRDIFNHALDALIERKGTKWLSDDRKNAEIAPGDVDFAFNDWGPRAAKNGWKLWALVVPESTAGRISMSGLVEAFFNLGVRVAVFTNLEEARAWLISH